jgi:hypothetical protein
MSAQSESKGPTILFLIIWYVVAHQPSLEDYAFAYALLLMLIGWLAIRMGTRAIYRLGRRAGFLMLQVAVWFGLFLLFIPAAGDVKVLTVWGVGLPLLFAGGLAHLAYARFPKYQNRLDAVPRIACVAILATAPLVSWYIGHGFWTGFWVAALHIIFAAIPLYYGWQLGEPLPRGDRDARFGTDEDYRAAGMSDER